MSWLVIGILPPLLWATVNHVDKYLLSKAHHKSSVNVLMVYSTGFSIIVLPILYFFVRGEIFQNGLQVVTQILGGILLTLSIYFYLVALTKDEASVVVPISLLVPVFGFIFSYLVLGELLSSREIIACLLIIAGSAVLSLEFEEEMRIKIKHGVFYLMVLSSAFQASQEVLFKYASIENSFTVSFFWTHVGILFFGIFLIIFNKNLVADFTNSVRKNGRILFGVNIISEVVSSIAFMIRDYATLLAPIAIIMVLNGYQPLFVFILGTILTILAPKFVQEKIRLVHLLHKGAAIAIILLGTFLLVKSLGA